MKIQINHAGNPESRSQFKSAIAFPRPIDRCNYPLFQPLLYQVATGSLSPANIAEPLRNIFKKQRNTRVLLAEAIDIDVEKREVVLSRAKLSALALTVPDA